MVKVEMSTDVLHRILERASNCGDAYEYFLKDGVIYWNNSVMHCDEPKECGKICQK